MALGGRSGVQNKDSRPIGPDACLTTFGGTGYEAASEAAGSFELSVRNPTHTAVDLGSNMVRLALGVIDEKGVATLVRKQVLVTRIAEGLSTTGRLSDGPIERTGRALDTFARTCAESRVREVAAVATGAFRLAANRDEVLARLSSRLGGAITVISGEREASLARRGIRSQHHGGDAFTVLDIGGTSTELAGDGVASSVPVGVVNLTEGCDAARPDDREAWLRAAAERAVAGLVAPDALPKTWFAAGGAAVALAAHRAGVGYLTYTGDDAGPLDRSALAAAYRDFRRAPRTARAAKLGITEAHVNLVPAGWALLDAALRRFGIDLVRPTGRGVVEGLLDERLSDQQQRGGRGTPRR